MHGDRSPGRGSRASLDAEASDEAALAAAIDAEIRRFEGGLRLSGEYARLTFGSALEAVYAQETRSTQVAVQRLILVMGLAFFVLTLTTDPAFVPDLHWTGVWARLPAIVCTVVTILMVGRLDPRRGGILVLLASVLCFLSLLVIPVLSRAPSAPYAFGTVCLASIYLSLVMTFRLGQAGLCNLVCLPPFLAAIALHPAVAPGAVFAHGLQAVVASLVGLIARYGIERNMRVTYLLRRRESARLSMVSAERERFATLSSLDGLTGLANRGHFDRSLDARLSDPAAGGDGVALIMIDVDHFKRYNDHYGHVAGDACLRTVAGVLMRVVRDGNDVAARFGGEEFAIVLPGATPNEAAGIAQRICSNVSALALPHANRDDGCGVVTVSVGLAHAASARDGTADALIEQADRALYLAKSRGRNRMVSRLPEAA